MPSRIKYVNPRFREDSRAAAPAYPREEAEHTQKGGALGWLKEHVKPATVGYVAVVVALCAFFVARALGSKPAVQQPEVVPASSQEAELDMPHGAEPSPENIAYPNSETLMGGVSSLTVRKAIAEHIASAHPGARITDQEIVGQATNISQLDRSEFFTVFYRATLDSGQTIGLRCEFYKDGGSDIYEVDKLAVGQSVVDIYSGNEIGTIG